MNPRDAKHILRARQELAEAKQYAKFLEDKLNAIKGKGGVVADLRAEVDQLRRENERLVRENKRLRRSMTALRVQASGHAVQPPITPEQIKSLNTARDEARSARQELESLVETVRSSDLAVDVDPDVEEAAMQLNIHPESVRRLIRLGKLPSYSVGIKKFIPRKALNAFAITYDNRPGNKRPIA